MWKRPKPGYVNHQTRSLCREMSKKRMEEAMGKPGPKPGSKRGKKATAPANRAIALIDALEFVAFSQKKAGTVPHTHCCMSGNWLVGTNGVMMIATPIADDMAVCPHTMQYLDALKKCGSELSISQLSQNQLSVNSGDFCAIIPCANFEELTCAYTAPDPETNPVSNDLKKAFQILTPMLNEEAQFGYLAGIGLKQNLMVATNGSLIIEYWHGMNLPGEFLIPKSSAQALAKCGKNLRGFGHSSNSVTFYFEDNSFIKTQLFAEKYVDYNKYFPEGVNYWPLSEKFYPAIKTIESFTKDGIVYFLDGVIASATNPMIASTYKIEGLPNGLAFNTKYLLICEQAMKNVFFDAQQKLVHFMADNVMRGVLLGVEYGDSIEKQRTEDVAF